MEWLGCRIATSGKWLRLDKVEMVDAGDLASLPSAYEVDFGSCPPTCGEAPCQCAYRAEWLPHRGTVSCPL